MAEQEIHQGALAEDPRRTDADSAERREDLFIVLGIVAVGLIVAFAGQAPQGLPWATATTAAGATAPAVAEQVARAFDALRGNVLAWRVVSLVIIGGVAGMIANRIIPGQRSGTTTAVLIGIAGSALGGWACQQFGYAVPTHISVVSVGVAFAGAAAALFGARLIASI